MHHKLSNTTRTSNGYTPNPKPKGYRNLTFDTKLSSCNFWTDKYLDEKNNKQVPQALDRPTTGGEIQTTDSNYKIILINEFKRNSYTGIMKICGNKKTLKVFTIVKL